MSKISITNIIFIAIVTMVSMVTQYFEADTLNLMIFSGCTKRSRTFSAIIILNHSFRSPASNFILRALVGLGQNVRSSPPPSPPPCCRWRTRAVVDCCWCCCCHSERDLHFPIDQMVWWCFLPMNFGIQATDDQPLIIQRPSSSSSTWWLVLPQGMNSRTTSTAAVSRWRRHDVYHQDDEVQGDFLAVAPNFQNQN